MKQAERYQLIDRIARELQSRFTADDLDTYLHSFGIKIPLREGGVSSKWVYAKGLLTSERLPLLLKIADDLDLEVAVLAAGAITPPSYWDGAGFRLFVSHISRDKEKAKRLRDCLAPYAIQAFVAHEDIDPTKPWELEIRRALLTMDAIVSIHTPGFSKSTWTQQEIGFAVCLRKKIIAFKMGEDPIGFLSSHQALLRKERTAEQIAAEIDRLLADDPATRETLAAAKASNSLAGF